MEARSSALRDECVVEGGPAPAPARWARFALILLSGTAPALTACTQPHPRRAATRRRIAPTAPAAPPPATAVPARCAPGRATIDRPDDSPLHQIRAYYVLPSDGVDEQLDLSAAIARSIAAFQTWLSSQSGGMRMRIDNCGGVPDVGFLRLNKTNAAIASAGAFVREEIEAGLTAAGLDRPNKLNLAYYGGHSFHACGGAPWPPRLSGKTTALYLKGTPPDAPPCATNRVGASPGRPGYVDLSALHETLHALGFVAGCAPHHTRAGHVSDDPRDLMYAGTAPWKPQFLDVGHDDYFRHGNAGCPDLASSAFVEPLPASPMLPAGWR